jgi:AmmeMemoRadiSam system protein B/AmmeMemoRadiSam system protein A
MLSSIMLCLSLFLASFSLSSCHKKTHSEVQPETIIHTAHLPSSWYPQDPNKLKTDLDFYFDLTDKHFPVDVALQNVRALIVPHAGHFYSGLCAATAYQTIRGVRDESTAIKRVIILAPSHFSLVDGIALPDYTVYRTALGDIPLDTEAIKILKRNDYFCVEPKAHQTEHAIEIQLPFLQHTLSDFKLVPLIVGNLQPKGLSRIISTLKRIIDRNTLIVVSSDFTHHGADYEYILFDKNITANLRQLDSSAVNAITQQSPELFSKMLTQTRATICGRDPICLLLRLLAGHQLGNVDALLSCYYTSAHLEHARKNATTLDASILTQDLPDELASRSVSYVGMVFASPSSADATTTPLTSFEQRALLTSARAVLKNSLKKNEDQIDERLLMPLMSLGALRSNGAFVTINTKSGNLRGCIGNIVSTNPLYQTVASMTKAAAFHDTRFTPVQAEELNNLELDITILTPPRAVESYQNIVLGTHGIILKKDNHSAVFLPQVAPEQGWDLETTLKHLALKAGLEHNAWQEGCSFEVFEGFEIKE